MEKITMFRNLLIILLMLICSTAWAENCKKVCPRGWMNWEYMDTCRQICRTANALEAGCK